MAESVNRCAGRCGTPVRDADTWCFGCWADFANSRAESAPVQPEPVKDSHQIREEILRNAYILKFGTEVQQIAALETLSHLVTVIQHINHQPNQTPEQKADQT